MSDDGAYFWKNCNNDISGSYTFEFPACAFLIFCNRAFTPSSTVANLVNPPLPPAVPPNPVSLIFPGLLFANAGQLFPVYREERSVFPVDLIPVDVSYPPPFPVDTPPV